MTAPVVQLTEAELLTGDEVTLDVDGVADLLGVKRSIAYQITTQLQRHKAGRKYVVTRDSVLAWHAANMPEVSQAIDMPEVPEVHGVYLLIHRDRVVYVGQSVRCHYRIATHRWEDRKRFDRARAIPCDDLDAMEVLLIDALRPKYNGNGGPRLAGTRHPKVAERLVMQSGVGVARGVTALLRWLLEVM